MSDFLFSIDVGVFYFFNHFLSASVLDKFFSTITNVNNWYIAYIILLAISFVKGGRKGKVAAVGVIILIIITDQTGGHLIKELVQRIRPCNALPDVITPLGCTGSYSFPSNHALNNFAAATFYYRLFPKLKWALFITACLIAISRVYLGLHYPSDVLGGALLGVIFGYIFSEIAFRMNKRLESNSNDTKNRSTSEKNQ
jgi:undecaprenyl-diphosphatase